MIVFATNNLHKLKEVRHILEGYEVVSLKDMNIIVDPEENGLTYEENALIKAREIAKHTNLPVLADDSGLEIDELPDELGLHTARFHNELKQIDRNKLVLKMMEGKKNRSSRFVCSAALLIDGKEYIYTYKCEGTITFEIEGEDGFGYDPIFLPNDANKSFGLLSEEEKNKISHRGVAMRKLIEIAEKNGEKL